MHIQLQMNQIHNFENKNTVVSIGICCWNVIKTLQFTASPNYLETDELKSDLHLDLH